MKVKVMLDKKLNQNKPQGAEVGAIQKRLAESAIEIELSVLAEMMSSGATFKPAYLNGSKNTDWVSQSLFVLDFDDGITFEEVMTRCNDINLIPAFCYASFSHLKDGVTEKFRVIWVVEEAITDIRLRNALQLALMTIFKESDKACKDASRLFYGGRELIQQNYDARINPADVIGTILPSYIKATDATNYPKYIKNYCQSVGLNMINNMPAVFITEESQEVQKETKSPHVLYIYYRGCGQIVQKCIFDFNIEDGTNFKTGRSGITVKKVAVNAEKAKVELERNFNFEALEKNCQLYDNFIVGEHWATYNEVFGMATNLCRFEGGQKRLTEGLENYENNYNSRFSYINAQNCITTINSYGYEPTKCSNFCPYVDTCEKNGVNMIHQTDAKRGSIRKIEDLKTNSVDEVLAVTKKVIVDAYNAEDNSIYVIKAPTGIGKTEIICNDLDLHNVCIAVPTHKLRAELLHKRLKDEFVSTARLSDKHDIYEEYVLYQRMGLFKKSYHLLDDYVKTLTAKENKPLSEKNKLYDANRAYKAKDFIKKADKVLTTHENMLYLDNKNINTYIVDEDIVPTILKIVEFVPDDFRTLIAHTPSETTKRALRAFKDEIENTPANRITKVPKYKVETQILDYSIEQCITALSTNVKEILDAHTFINAVEPNGKIKTYMIISKASQLRADKKYIIMSATANEFIYKQLFGDRVKFIECGLVKPKGKIVLHSKKSFSKSSLNKGLEDNIAYIKETIKEGTNVITFKQYEETFKKNGLNVVATFGATAGLDSFKGQDLAVVGTYHVNDNVYALYAAALDVRTTCDDFNFDEMEYTCVKRNGYEFFFNTYSNNPLLQEIQFYLIEAEMLQAIGRARSNRLECTVHLFSNLPVPLCELEKR